MTVELVTITDPNLPEPKGLSAASSGDVLVADGLGSGSWSANFLDVSFTSKLDSVNTTTQGPSVADTAYQVVFGAASGSGTDVEVSAAGLITFNTTGTYLAEFYGFLGRTAGTGVADIFFRSLTNGSSNGDLQYIRLENAEEIKPVRFSLVLAATATDTLSFEMIRDSSGNNSGSLIPGTVTAAGWGSSPSARVVINRVQR